MNPECREIHQVNRERQEFPRELFQEIPEESHLGSQVSPEYRRVIRACFPEWHREILLGFHLARQDFHRACQEIRRVNQEPHRVCREIRQEWHRALLCREL